MESNLLQRLTDKAITKKDLIQAVEGDFSLLPIVVSGVYSPKAAIRYGCGSILMDLSRDYPEKLYPYFDQFKELLNGKYRILIWNSLAIMANLAKVDIEGKLDTVLPKYYGFLNDEYMVTVANVVGNLGKIAFAKPHLAQRIADELLNVEEISTTSHLTEECKRVIAEAAIESFDLFFDKIEDGSKIIGFVRRQMDSPRNSLRTKATAFLEKWDK